jgi:hypothetical protein
MCLPVVLELTGDADGDRLVFRSTGTWEEPLIQGCLDEPDAARGQEILCIMGNSQVSGALSSPVAITPQLPLLPFTPDYIPERCPDRSIDPQWVVDKFLYQHHDDKSYDVFVDLTNKAVDEAVSCHVAFDRKAGASLNGTTRWSKCTPAVSGTLVLTTEISLEAEYGILGIRQSWTCPDFIQGIDEYVACLLFTSVSDNFPDLCTREKVTCPAFLSAPNKQRRAHRVHPATTAASPLPPTAARSGSLGIGRRHR